MIYSIELADYAGADYLTQINSAFDEVESYTDLRALMYSRIVPMLEHPTLTLLLWRAVLKTVGPITQR